jgi:hypothetical protein
MPARLQMLKASKMQNVMQQCRTYIVLRLYLVLSVENIKLSDMGSCFLGGLGFGYDAGHDFCNRVFNQNDNVSDSDEGFLVLFFNLRYSFEKYRLRAGFFYIKT